MSRFPIVYDRALKPSGGPQPGAVYLMDWCLANVATASNLGIYNNRSVRGGKSLSVHAEGRALDVGFPARVGGTTEGWALAALLRAHHADLGIQLCVYAQRTWSATRGAVWRTYTGSSPHNEHIHLELNRRAARELTPAMINETLGGAMAANESVLAIQKAVNSVGYDPPLVEDGEVGEKTAAAVEDLIKTRSMFEAQRDSLVLTRDRLAAEQVELQRRTVELETMVAELRDTRDGDVARDEVLVRKAALVDQMAAAFRGLVDEAGLGATS